MSPKVSIVVPIYNVENYLARCLDSLLAQRLANIEIIAVNDGSTDASGTILEEYAGRDGRIVAIHQRNRGVSSARNAGIRAARGEFVGFVDPDDWIDPDMYEEMYGAGVEEQADIVMCTYIREFGTFAKVKTFDLPEKVCYRGDEVQTKMLRRLIGPIKEEIADPSYLDAWGTVWSKLYRLDMIREHGIEFVDLDIVGTNEDSLYNIHAFYHASSFVFLNQPFYHYWRANDTSVTAGYKPDLNEKWFRLYGVIEKFLSENRLSAEYHLALNNRICLNTLGLGLNTICRANQASVFAKLAKLGAILNDPRIRNSFLQFETVHCPAVWKVFFICARTRFVPGFYFLLVAIDRLRRVAR